MFKILLERFVPLAPGFGGEAGGRGGREGGRAERKEGGEPGREEGGGDCRLGCRGRRRALRQAGGSRGGRPVSRALPGRRGRSFGVGRPIVGVAAWVAMGTGLFPGGCDGLTGA